MSLIDKIMEHDPMEYIGDEGYRMTYSPEERCLSYYGSSQDKMAKEIIRLLRKIKHMEGVN